MLLEMTGAKALEIQVKTLEKGMGTLVRALEDKVENKYNEEVKEIMENQKKLEDFLRDSSVYICF